MNSTNLFDVINPSFFNLLSSSSSNRIYSGAIIAIYNVYEHEVSFKLDRSTVRDAVAAYLMDIHASGDESKQYNSPNDFATEILKKFCNAGWISEETDDTTYERMIIMTDQGILLAEFLQNLIKPPKEEYTSYLLNIYNILRSPQQWESDPYIYALKEVYKNAKKLSNSLKKLSTSIRTIIEKMVKEETLESLTENLLAYCEGDFIKEYSRLVKKQNIHIYRTDIKIKLEELRHDDKMYDIIVTGYFCEEEPDSEPKAEIEVHNMFETTLRFLTEDYDKIMYDIKKKINIYLNLAIGRASFLMNHDVNSRGCVEQVLKFLLDEFGDEHGDSMLPQEYDALFNLYEQSFLDKNSIRFLRKPRVNISSLGYEVPDMTEEDIEKTRLQHLKESYNPYSRQSMKKYIENAMGTRTEISASELPMERKGDILAVVASVAYAQDNGFDIIVSDDYLEKEAIMLRNFVIRRK